MWCLECMEARRRRHDSALTETLSGEMPTVHTMPVRPLMLLFVALILCLHPHASATPSEGKSFSLPLALNSITSLNLHHTCSWMIEASATVSPTCFESGMEFVHILQLRCLPNCGTCGRQLPASSSYGWRLWTLAMDPGPASDVH